MERVCRGVRGATTVETNEPAAILAATRELLERIVAANGIRLEDVASVIFSTTPDLDAEFPARAAREMGWLDAALLCTHEMRVPRALPRCIRVLLHWNTTRRPGEIRHIYLRGARRLRPDRAADEPSSGNAAPATPAAAVNTGDAVLGRVAVFGLGLIGGSLGMALNRAGLATSLIGYDTDAATAARALEAGVVDRVASDPAAAAAAADTVLLAAPVRAILELLDRVAPHLRPGTLVLDAGSTKRRVAQRMGRLPEGIRAVAAHPMCGKEKAGLEHAEAGLFEGATFVLCATDRTDDVARDAAERLVAGVGARPLWLDADAHDAAVAAVSHLPYLLSVSLVRAALDGADGPTARLAASGFRDTSRLAASDVRMCLDILATNGDAVLAALDRAAAELDGLRSLLAAGDVDRLAPVLAAAAERRRGWAGADR
ncbi:MAG TPA: chorismate mutase [Longimicrobiales bacterium]